MFFTKKYAAPKEAWRLKHGALCWKMYALIWRHINSVLIYPKVSCSRRYPCFLFFFSRTITGLLFLCSKKMNPWPEIEIMIFQTCGSPAKGRGSFSIDRMTFYQTPFTCFWDDFTQTSPLTVWHLLHYWWLQSKTCLLFFITYPKNGPFGLLSYARNW